MKRCKQCGETLSYESFYRKKGSKDGYESSCSDCKRERVRSNRAAKSNHYKEYDRARGKLARRKDYLAEASTRYRATDKGKANSSKNAQIWKMNNREKIKAHTIVSRAVQRGDIQKPIRCEKCNKYSERLQAHHYDHSKPLDVVWLCSYCHNQSSVRRNTVG